MTSSYLIEMHDVIGVNVFPLQVNEISPHEKGLRHPYPTTANIYLDRNIPFFKQKSNWNLIFSLWTIRELGNVLK